MNANTTKTIIGTLLPFASNPVVLTVLGVGAVAWAIASIFDNDTEGESNGSNTVQSRSEPSKQPSKRNRSTAQSTVRKPLETVQATVHEPFETAGTSVAATGIEPLTPTLPMKDEIETAPLVTDDETIASVTDQTSISERVLLDAEAAKKEMIRKAMSELGKRSAAARAKKSTK